MTSTLPRSKPGPSGCAPQVRPRTYSLRQPSVWRRGLATVRLKTHGGCFQAKTGVRIGEIEGPEFAVDRMG